MRSAHPRLAALIAFGLVLTACAGSDSQVGASPTGTEGTTAESPRDSQTTEAPQAAEPDVVDVGIFSIGVNYWCYYSAVDQGYFEAQNIEIPQPPLLARDDAETTRALLSDEVQVALAGFSVLSAMEEGTTDQPVVIGSTGSPAYAIVGPGDDLTGTTIAVQPEGTSATAMMVKVLNMVVGEGNWNPLYTGGGTPGRLAAVEAGQADAALAVSPGAEQIDDESDELKIIGYFTEITPEPYQIGAVMATRDWLDENADVASRFMRAYADGCAFLEDSANKEDAVRILAEQLDADPAIVSTVYDVTIADDADGNFTTPRASADAIGNLAEAMVEAGILEGTLDIEEDVIDQSYMDAAEDLPSSVDQ